MFREMSEEYSLALEKGLQTGYFRISNVFYLIIFSPSKLTGRAQMWELSLLIFHSDLIKMNIDFVHSDRRSSTECYEGEAKAALKASTLV